MPASAAVLGPGTLVVLMAGRMGRVSFQEHVRPVDQQFGNTGREADHQQSDGDGAQHVHVINLAMRVGEQQGAHPISSWSGARCHVSGMIPGRWPERQHRRALGDEPVARCLDAWRAGPEVESCTSGHGGSACSHARWDCRRGLSPGRGRERDPLAEPSQDEAVIVDLLERFECKMTAAVGGRGATDPVLVAHAHSQGVDRHSVMGDQVIGRP